MIYGKLPVAFLSAIASEKQGSTNSVIAGYILDHLDQTRDMSISDLARACSVSNASMSRFCKDVGFTDFSELRSAIASSRLEFQRQDSPETCARSAAESIDQVLNSVDMAAVGELCRDIRTYKKAAAFGLMKAGAAALNLQSDLLMLGKQVYTNVSYPQQLKYISEADSDTVIVIFSYTGSYFDYPETPALLFSSGGRPKIWMLSGKQHRYPKYVSRTIHFDSPGNQAGHPYQLLFLSQLIAQEYAKL